MPDAPISQAFGRNDGGDALRQQVTSLCAELTATAALFPGTTLRLIDEFSDSP